MGLVGFYITSIMKNFKAGLLAVVLAGDAAPLLSISYSIASSAALVK